MTEADTSGGGPPPARPSAPSALRVLLLALLGYAVLGTTLTLLSVALVLLFRLLLTGKLTIVAVKLGIFLAPLGWFIVRALWVRIQPPSGLELRATEAPSLFGLVERVRRALRARRVDTVLLTDDLNAGVAHVPWFGLVGPGRTYLVLGLPLLQAVTEPQLEAILAHEFGHVSGKHTRFGAWVYRTRLTWARLAGQIEDASVGAPLRRSCAGSTRGSTRRRWQSPACKSFRPIAIRRSSPALATPRTRSSRLTSRGVSSGSGSGASFPAGTPAFPSPPRSCSPRRVPC